MSNIKESAISFSQEILNGIREKNYERIDEAVFAEKADCLLKTTKAFLELEVSEEKIILVLQKYWDLRRSEAVEILEKAKIL